MSPTADWPRRSPRWRHAAASAHASATTLPTARPPAGWSRACHRASTSRAPRSASWAATGSRSTASSTWRSTTSSRRGATRCRQRCRRRSRTERDMTVVDVVVAVAGGLVVTLTGLSAIVTVVVPRGEPAKLTRAVFRVSRRLFEIRSTILRHGYEQLDRSMSRYAPITLVSLAFVWLVCVLAGYTAIFHGLDEYSWIGAFEIS